MAYAWLDLALPQPIRVSQSNYFTDILQLFLSSPASADQIINPNPLPLVRCKTRNRQKKKIIIHDAKTSLSGPTTQNASLQNSLQNQGYTRPNRLVLSLDRHFT